jgi:hypothetical protein
MNKNYEPSSESIKDLIDQIMIKSLLLVSVSYNLKKLNKLGTS